MPFAATTKPRIIYYEAYEISNTDSITSTTLSQIIDQQLSYIETYLPDLIALIEADLAEIVALNSTLATEQGSTNAALIKADVLEWQPGSKTSGIQSRYDFLRMRVAKALSQAIDSGVGSQGMLMRG